MIWVIHMSSHRKIDVLNLEWHSKSSRDREMATLVCNYLRYCGYKVEERSVFDGYSLLSKSKPKLFFIASTTGAKINLDLMRYARFKNILGASLTAEGDFKEGAKNVEQFQWGWNKEKKLYENVHMQWSERTRKMTLAMYPSIKNRLKVSGGVGFDIYKIAERTDALSFLKKYKKESFSKVIGVGCWNFGFVYPEDYRYEIISSQYTESQIERFRKDGKKFNKILLGTVKNNSDILFLLKEHPGATIGKKASAIEGLDALKNVLIIKNEEPIIKCLNMSDFWISYESTTALEAWLLDKQTCLLDPSGTDFPRAKVYLGSPNYRCQESLQNAIDSFYSSDELPGFKELEENRRKIIKDVIQWDDGLNHVRAGNEIINLIENHDVSHIKKDDIKSVVKKYLQRMEWYFTPCFRFLPRVNEYYTRRGNFNLKTLKELQEKRMKEQLEYYEKRGLDKASLKKVKCI